MAENNKDDNYASLEEISSFLVSDNEAGLRLDRFLADKIDGHSRSRIKSLIKNGKTKLNDIVTAEPNYRVKTSDKISIEIPTPEDPTPKGENIELNILYEDDDLIVIDKPSGLVVHPAAGNWSGTLVNALIAHCGNSLSGIGGVRRPGIVHRLDKDTTGIMVIAKNDSTHHHLSNQFADHGKTGELVRSYKALTWSYPPKFKGVINLPIGRDKHNRLKQAIDKKNGKAAITEYRLIEKYYSNDKSSNQIKRSLKIKTDKKSLASLVECTLKTGRTHQIRVHLSQLGCPVIGDQTYGKGFESSINILDNTTQKLVSKFKRQALHAYKLQFIHPKTEELLTFTSDLPKDIQKIIDSLKLNNL